MTGLSRLILAGTMLAVAGCSYDAFVYTTDRYGSGRSGPVNVTLHCRDTYAVYDRPDASSLMVMTSALNESLVFCLDGGAPPLAVRQRQVAELYFTEKVNKPACRITSERELSAIHREFSYRCPAVPQGPRIIGAPLAPDATPL